ncbi:MAG: cysteine hydrolase [Proteobacteria bacterium]|nr:cysteine hydrolase [Pseudomonadota bacterium]
MRTKHVLGAQEAGHAGDAIADSGAPGSWGGEFVKNIIPHPSEMVITKHRYSAFVDTRLELFLRSYGIRTVVIAGTTTNAVLN